MRTKRSAKSPPATDIVRSDEHQASVLVLSKFESPADGDIISVTFEGHHSYWFGPLIYREQFVDAKGTLFPGACVYGDEWERRGEVAYSFQKIEFWCCWEGESNEEYAERRKKIIADSRASGQGIDPFDSFRGENSIQGQWTPPKIGPAFKLVEIEDGSIRPLNNALVEISVRGSSDLHIGRFFAAADRIYTEQRLCEVSWCGPGNKVFAPVVRAALQGRKLPGHEVEIVYSNKVRYGTPLYPFSEWERYRLVAEDGDPLEITGDESSGWVPGPCFQEWLEREAREANERRIRAFEQWNQWLDTELRTATGTAERVVILRRTLRLELENSSEERDLYVQRLQSKLDHFEEVLTVERGVSTSSSNMPPQVAAGSAALEQPLAFEQAWLLDDLAGANSDLIACRLLRIEDRNGEKRVVWAGNNGELGHIVDFLVEIEAFNSPTEYEKIAYGLFTQELVPWTGRQVKKCRHNARSSGTPSVKVSRAKTYLKRRFQTPPITEDTSQPSTGKVLKKY